MPHANVRAISHGGLSPARHKALCRLHPVVSTEYSGREGFVAVYGSKYHHPRIALLLEAWLTSWQETQGKSRPAANKATVLPTVNIQYFCPWHR
jgi:hypothetical protein